MWNVPHTGMLRSKLNAGLRKNLTSQGPSSESGLFLGYERVITMLYLAFLTICVVTPINGWQGDPDTGPTCIKVYDLQRPQGYASMQQCDFRLAEMWAEAKEREAEITSIIRKPWNVYGTCESQRLYEVHN